MKTVQNFADDIGIDASCMDYSAPYQDTRKEKDADEHQDDLQRSEKQEGRTSAATLVDFMLDRSAVDSDEEDTEHVFDDPEKENQEEELPVGNFADDCMIDESRMDASHKPQRAASNFAEICAIEDIHLDDIDDIGDGHKQEAALAIDEVVGDMFAGLATQSNPPSKQERSSVSRSNSPKKADSYRAKRISGGSRSTTPTRTRQGSQRGSRTGGTRPRSTTPPRRQSEAIPRGSGHRSRSVSPKGGYRASTGTCPVDLLDGSGEPFQNEQNALAGECPNNRRRRADAGARAGRNRHNGRNYIVNQALHAAVKSSFNNGHVDQSENEEDSGDEAEDEVTVEPVDAEVDPTPVEEEPTKKGGKKAFLKKTMKKAKKQAKKQATKIAKKSGVISGSNKKKEEEGFNSLNAYIEAEPGMADLADSTAHLSITSDITAGTRTSLAGQQAVAT